MAILNKQTNSSNIFLGIATGKALVGAVEEDEMVSLLTNL